MRIILPVMNYVAEIASIEARLKAIKCPVRVMLEEADVAPSQWQRWKSQHHEPHRTTWARIVSATEKMLSEREGAAA